MSTGRTTHDSESDPAATGHRVLVVANETVEGRELLDEIRRRTQDRQPDRKQGRTQDRTKDTQTQVHVVAPALIRSRIRHGLGDVDEAKEEAEQRLQRSISAIERLGVAASGEVGDSNPNLAIKDALVRFPADEVIISTHPRERSTWLEKKVVERARNEIKLPITHVVVDIEARTEP